MFLLLSLLRGGEHTQKTPKKNGFENIIMVRQNVNSLSNNFEQILACYLKPSLIRMKCLNKHQ